MAIESKVCSLGNSCVRLGNHSQLRQFSFAYVNSGQCMWQSKELPSLRRTDTKLRAERVTRRPHREGSDRWRDVDREDLGDAEGTSSWDANAENVRRRRYTERYSSRLEEDEEPSSSMRERNNRSDNTRLDYEGNDRSRNGPWGFERSNRNENREWDYDSESERTQTEPEGWQLWFGDNDDDTDWEEQEDYEEEVDWLSWLNVDIKDVSMLLRWGLPAAFLLCTAVIPVMVGNPLILLFGFSIFPTVVKFFNPLVKDFFNSVDNPFGSSSSTRTKNRSQSAPVYSRRSQDTAKYSDFGSPSEPLSRSYDHKTSSPSQPISSSYDSNVSSPSQPISRSYGSDVIRRNIPLKASDLGGWDDLVDDRYRIKAERRWPLQRRAKSGKKLARRKQPLFIRIVLALFPFLRGWAGLS